MKMLRSEIWFYPVGNGDSTLILGQDGEKFMVDYYSPQDSESEDDPRIYLPDELDEKLVKDDLDVLVITHPHDDHFGGFSDYFYLEHAKTYQGDGRRRVKQIWVPECVIWETGINGEEKVLRTECRHRLLKLKSGIKIFGCSNALKDYINSSEGVSWNDVSHLIFPAGSVIKDFSSFEIFIHSPHSWKSEGDENKNNKSIVMQLDFKDGSESISKVIMGSDAEADAWDSIYTSTQNNDNKERLDFDVFNLSHHCSHTALSPEKGDLITNPIENVKKLFDEHGRYGCYIIASCDPIPSQRDRNESGPPHYQAKEYYKTVAADKNGFFMVTMEQPHLSLNCKPIAIEISKYGPSLKAITQFSIGAGVAPKSKSEKHG